MATAAGSSTESEALRISFDHLVNSIDTAALLPKALRAHLVSQPQRSECATEPDPYKKAEKFLGHLQRAVNGDSNKYHTFIQVLKETGQASIASRLGDELTKTNRLMPSGEQLIVPSDELLEELAGLRISYARLLRGYKKILQENAEAQEEFVETVPGVIHRELRPDHSFQSYFNILIDEEVSLFNITYLKKFCDIFPDDVCTATKELVDKYEKQRQQFMASTTLNQFKQLFPASATTSKMSAGKLLITVKLKSYWGDNTVEELTTLVNNLDVPGSHLHLYNVQKGCIAATWLCPAADFKELRGTVEAADSLESKGVLRVFAGEGEIMWECSQPDQAQQLTNKPKILAFNFIHKPEDDQLCSVCKEPLFEPFLTDCGHYVCHTCRDNLLKANKDECPICRKPNALSNARINSHLQRQVNSLKVRCQHHKKGCKWVGEVRYLQDHLDPERGECVIACPFGCGQYCWKKEMKKHMKQYCHKRLTTCKYCGSYYGTHDTVTEKHYPVCTQYPITCPNKCRTKWFKLVRMQRCQLQQHLAECPLQLVECPCSNTGCSVQLPRRAMAAHTLQQHNQTLEQIINQAVAITPPPATVSPQYLYNLPPVVFTITDYQEKKQANEVWTSPPYYTHTRGYKFCLEVYPNGDGSGKDTHISVYTCLMRGEYDDELEWPFKGDFMIEFLNWKEDKYHFSHSVDFNKYTDPDGTFTSRVIDKETAIGLGNPQFISHTNLKYNSTTNTEYLYDDCLRLRVGVAMYSTALLHKTPSWQNPLTTTQSVCEFTLTEFSKRKQFNNRYFSPPFYTHPQSYKLCLQVLANGDGSGKSTHVSVFATLMRGEHDQHLQWPFTGGIIFELLNWREDKEHHKMTMSIDPSDGYVRVTEGTYGRSLGKAQFISHSFLPYNSTTNTEYLQEDCLRLRMGVNIIYSSALLHKTPPWQNPLTTTQSVCEFTVTEFSKWKQLNNEYVSPPFYTHSQGYKLCLKMYANGSGSGEGTHVSTFATLMRGEYDQHLQWPFTGDIIFELLNWRKDKEHHKMTLSIDPSHGFVRVTEVTYGNSLGYNQFISHSFLPYNSTTNTEYLQEDCLRLRVGVAMYSTALLHKTPSWQDPLTTTQSVCEFTLTEFSKRKQFNNRYTSPPFYTHSQGYKLCSEVDANGDGSSEGTHVSIFARLMKGEHDDSLQWPFEADIIIELLNWREDKNHHSVTISFSRHADPDGTLCNQVTEGEYADCLWGEDQFIYHSSLSYNSTTNTEYLQEDCMQLRVKEVVFYSTALLHKTPSWQEHLTTQSVCEFTLTEFSKRKESNNEYMSPPFYTHPGGYNMVLNVYVNGYKSAQDTHVTVRPRLMKGEHDDDLRWPFVGDVIVELLNWREDNEHQTRMVEFNSDTDPDGKCSARVTEGYIADKSWYGRYDLFSHSSLLYDPSTNTEYLHDDCLRLRVRKVCVYSM